MTDEKNQGGGSGETAAERLAQQRKALNLQTQPLEVIADLDWDVDDDDAEFTLPTPTISPEPAQKTPSKERASSGTMAMSASDFAQAMKNETADTASTGAAATAQVAQEDAVQAATTAKTDVVDTAPHLTREPAQTAATSSGGTMLLSGDAMKEAMEAAKIEAEDSGAEYRETAPHAAIDDAAKESETQRSASGTMLMSADAIQEEIHKQASGATGPTAQTTSNANTGSVEEVSTPAHEPQAPAWNEEEPRREAAQWSAPSTEESNLQPGGLLPGLSPNLKVTLAIGAVIVAVILLWLIFR